MLLLSFVNLFVNSRISRRLEPFVEAVETATSDLDLLVEILKILEREQFQSPRLVRLLLELKSGGVTPSTAVRKLDRIVRYLEQRRNLLVRVLDGFVFYTAQCMLRAESWQREFGPAIRGWLAIVGETEVLAALSGYAFEHPDDAWPEFDERPCFDAEPFAHPLLPEGKAVRNDLEAG